MTKPTTYIWIDGEMVDMAQTGSSLLDHALHYGTGVFEGIRCYPTPWGPSIFRLGDHMDRLAAGADVLGIPLNTAVLSQAARDVVDANELQSAYIRPIVFYGAGSLGLDVDSSMKIHSVVAAMPWKSHLGEASEEQGVRVHSSSIRRIPADSVPPLKFTGVYLNSIIAKRQAVEAGCEEALFVDPDGRVCEATGENVFIVKDGRVTAVDHPDALAGITRDTVMRLSRANSRAVFMDELLNADEIFLTGTSAEVAPVTYIDGVELAVGPVTRRLQAQYQDLVHGRLAGRDGWLSPVKPCAA